MPVIAGQKWRHVKRGSTYEVLSHTASLQCACAPEVERQFEDDNFTVYRNTATGAIYVRPSEEFLDGRFVQLPDEE